MQCIVWYPLPHTLLTIITQALVYARVRAFGLPSMLLLSAMEGIFRGRGDTSAGSKWRQTSSNCSCFKMAPNLHELQLVQNGAKHP